MCTFGDSLHGFMFTNGSGRAADVLYTLVVLLCTLLINPIQLGRGRIICKHTKKVYKKNVSGIINKEIYGK